MNLDGWEGMIALGFSAAVSVRVSNELGAGRPSAAKVSAMVVNLTTIVIGLFFMILIFITKNGFPTLFTNSEAVMAAVTNLSTLLALTMLLNSVQPVLSGVAVGAGWQARVAIVNLVCYYIVGVPFGVLLGYSFNLGAKGIWSGMISGTVLQVMILLVITWRTDWNREASEIKDRIKVWGGSVTPSQIVQ